MYVREDRGRFPPVVSTNGKHTHYTSPREKQETHKRREKYFPTLVLHFTHLWSKHTFNVFKCIEI